MKVEKGGIDEVLDVKAAEISSISFSLSDAYDSDLQKSLSGLSNMDLPTAIAYRVAKLVRKFQSEIKSSETVFAALRERFGVKDDNGTFRVLQPEDPKFAETEGAQENFDSFKKEVDGVMEERFTADFAPIKEYELAGTKLKPAVVATLMEYGILA